MQVLTYLSLGYDTREDPQQGLYIPVSTELENTLWKTIPWDEENADPENQHAMPNGWTILHGPAHYMFSAGARFKNQQVNASFHLRFWKAFVDPITGVEVRTWASEAEESFVGPGEGNNTHCNLSWNGWLAANERLRVEVDYWHATAGARLVGASVSGFYFRPIV